MFFHQTSLPGPIRDILEPFSFLANVHRVIQVFNFPVSGKLGDRTKIMKWDITSSLSCWFYTYTLYFTNPPQDGAHGKLTLQNMEWMGGGHNLKFRNPPLDGAHVQKITNGGCSLYVPVRSELYAALSLIWRGYSWSPFKSPALWIQAHWIDFVPGHINYTPIITIKGGVVYLARYEVNLRHLYP